MHKKTINWINKIIFILKRIIIPKFPKREFQSFISIATDFINILIFSLIVFVIYKWIFYSSLIMIITRIFLENNYFNRFSEENDCEIINISYKLTINWTKILIFELTS